MSELARPLNSSALQAHGSGESSLSKSVFENAAGERGVSRGKVARWGTESFYIVGRDHAEACARGPLPSIDAAHDAAGELAQSNPGVMFYIFKAEPVAVAKGRFVQLEWCVAPSLLEAQAEPTLDDEDE